MIPLLKPYMPPVPELNTILMSGHLAYGAASRQFEELLREWFGTPYLMAVNTFSNGICVALSALGLRPGDEVIASPMGCLASAQPLLTYGLKVRWADVDPGTGTLSPESVRRQITHKTRCIFHNHFCGYPGDVDAVNSLGREFGIAVIDDGIECFGSEVHGTKIGVTGADAAVFSLGPVRIPNTIDGGVVIFREQKAYEAALLLRDCGIDRTRFRDAQGEIDPGCDISMPGYSALMSDVNGAIGVEQMKHVDGLLEKQRTQAVRWRERLAGQTGLKLLSRPGTNPNYWVFGLLADHKAAAMQSFREAGYYASGVHVDLSRYSVFGPCAELPGAVEFARRFLAMPCGWWMES